MSSLTNALAEIIAANPTIQIGLSNRLFNLSQLARFLLPSIQARVEKSVTDSALLMALSRYQREIQKLPELGVTAGYRFKNIQVTSNLAIFTYNYSSDLMRQVIAAAKEIESKGRALSFTHGLGQMTIFVDDEDASRIKSRLHGRLIQENRNISVVGAIFSEEECRKPGFFHAVFQQLYLQKINVIEVASTMTELLIYIEESDLHLAFNTLYNRFIRES